MNKATTSAPPFSLALIINPSPSTQTPTNCLAWVLAPGELLRSIFLPATALKKRYAFRRFSLTHLGRSEVLLIGTLDQGKDEFILTVTASTLRPVQLRFENVPPAQELKGKLDQAVPFNLYLDDPHGSPPHRQHLTYYFAEQIRQSLAA